MYNAENEDGYTSSTEVFKFQLISKEILSIGLTYLLRGTAPCTIVNRYLDLIISLNCAGKELIDSVT